MGWPTIASRVVCGETLATMESVIQGVEDFVDMHPGGQ